MKRHIHRKQIWHRMIIDQIIHSDRKTFGLQIKPDGRLIVRAPRHASRAQIQAVVAKKAGWIKKTRDRLARDYPHLTPKTFTEGERFWFLGAQYALQLTDRKRPALVLEGHFSLSRNKQDRAKALFIAWYREQTRGIVHALIEGYQERFGFSVNQVRITSARTRWGSCSGKNNLNFTYRLSMAPRSVVAYVVVHELVHLTIRDHSPRFWRGVAEIKADYQKDRDWLKKNGPLLTLD